MENVERDEGRSLPPISALNVGVSGAYCGGQGNIVSEADERLDPSNKWEIKL